MYKCLIVNESKCHGGHIQVVPGDNSTHNTTGKCGQNVTIQVAVGGYDVSSDISSTLRGGRT
jgi:hypothetical protein